MIALRQGEGWSRLDASPTLAKGVTVARALEDRTIEDDIAVIEKHLEWQFRAALTDSVRYAEFGAGVCLFTELLRDQGKPVEHVLVRLKDAMRRARGPALGDSVLGKSADRVIGSAVLRSIEHYYGVPHSDRASHRNSDGN
jgi:hypothetical protein